MPEGTYVVGSQKYDRLLRQISLRFQHTSEVVNTNYDPVVPNNLSCKTDYQVNTDDLKQNTWRQYRMEKSSRLPY